MSLRGRLWSEDMLKTHLGTQERERRHIIHFNSQIIFWLEIIVQKTQITSLASYLLPMFAPFSNGRNHSEKGKDFQRVEFKCQLPEVFIWVAVISRVGVLKCFRLFCSESVQFLAFPAPTYYSDKIVWFASDFHRVDVRGGNACLKCQSGAKKSNPIV